MTRWQCEKNYKVSFDIFFEGNVFRETQDCVCEAASILTKLFPCDFVFFSQLKIYLKGKTWGHLKNMTAQFNTISKEVPEVLWPIEKLLE